jgi:histidinol-phosphate aminotransferase
MSAKQALVSPAIASLSPYVPGKPIEEVERELGISNAVKLASNENPMGPSPRALEAAAQALQGGHRYPDGYRLRSALARHHGVPMEELVLGNGSNELLDIICRTYGQPGGHAVFPDPSFVVYRMSTTAMSMEATAVPMIGHVAYDVDALLAAVRPNTQLFFLANPNNPTGCYVGRADVERILRALPERTIAVFDEAYFEFPDAPDYVSALDFRALHENTIVLRTFSKAYGLAGLRVGYGIAPRQLIDYVDRVRAPFNVNNLGLAAALAALEDTDYLARYLEHNRVERARVTRELSALGLTVAPSQANFVLVNFARSGREVHERLMRKGVIVRPQPPPLSEFVRITIGLTAENDRLIESVREFLEESR